jgi:hypothetical protein
MESRASSKRHSLSDVSDGIVSPRLQSRDFSLIRPRPKHQRPIEAGRADWRPNALFARVGGKDRPLTSSRNGDQATPHGAMSIRQIASATILAIASAAWPSP